MKIKLMKEVISAKEKDWLVEKSENS